LAVGKALTFAAATLAIVGVVPAAHGTVRHPQTTAPDVFVNIQVKVTDTRITLDRHSANRGDEGRFILRNVGKKPHTFTLGTTTKKGGAAQTGFSRLLKPGEQKILILFLDYRGPVPYRSTLAHDRTLAGMRGVFHVR
jgi:hypothetical protein